jgi:predicted enzyme related to lactoylglutathione lyase
MTAHMVTIDCVDPQALAKFWTEAAGYTVGVDWGEYIMLVPSAGSLRIGLQRVPEPRTGKNRVHVDWRTADRETEVRRLVDLEASVVGSHQVPGLAWTVLSDPEGNEFCVAQEELGDPVSAGPPAGSVG